MPLHVHPALRALEEALESEGLIKTLNSAGVLVQQNKETAGIQPKVVPVNAVRVIRGNTYKAS